MSRVVTVIGGGPAGLSVAVLLAERGVGVRLVEPRPLEMSAMTRSAGIHVSILPSWLRRAAGQGLALYRRLDPGLAQPVRALWIVPRPCAGSPEVREMLREGVAEPLAGPPGGLGAREGEAYFWVREHIVDAGRALSLLLSRALELGVELVEEPAEPGGECRPRLRGRPLEPPVVVAAGPWTPRVCPGLSRYLAVYRCQLATIEGARPPFPVEDDALGYYIVPVGPSRSNIGDGSNQRVEDPMDAFAPDPEDTYTVVERYAERNPEAWEARIVQMWSAPCASTGDGIPLLDEARPGVWVLTGLNGAGLTLAPGLALLLVEALATGAPVPGALRLGPGKEAGPGRPREPHDLC